MTGLLTRTSRQVEAHTHFLVTRTAQIHNHPKGHDQTITQISSRSARSHTGGDFCAALSLSPVCVGLSVAFSCSAVVQHTGAPICCAFVCVCAGDFVSESSVGDAGVPFLRSNKPANPTMRQTNQSKPTQATQTNADRSQQPQARPHCPHTQLCNPTLSANTKQRDQQRNRPTNSTNQIIRMFWLRCLLRAQRGI